MTEATLSRSEYCLTALITPTGTPTRIAMIMAKAVSSKVAGRRSRSSVVTGRPVTIESPRSPLTAPFRKTRYWTGSGSSSPSWFLTLGHLLLGSGLPQHDLRGISGDGPHHAEHDDGDPEQNRDDLEDPASYVLSQRRDLRPRSKTLLSPPYLPPEMEIVLNGSLLVGLGAKPCTDCCSPIGGST